VLNAMNLEEIMQHLRGRAALRSAHGQRAPSRRKVNSFAQKKCRASIARKPGISAT